MFKIFDDRNASRHTSRSTPRHTPCSGAGTTTERLIEHLATASIPGLDAELGQWLPQARFDDIRCER